MIRGGCVFNSPYVPALFVLCISVEYLMADLRTVALAIVFSCCSLSAASAQSTQEGTVPVNGAQIHYTSTGTGVPITQLCVVQVLLRRYRAAQWSGISETARILLL